MPRKILVHAVLALAYFSIALVMVLFSVALFEHSLPNFFLGWALYMPAVVLLMGAHQAAEDLPLRWGLAYALMTALLWTAFLAVLFGSLDPKVWWDTVQTMMGPIFLPTTLVLFLLNLIVSAGNDLLARTRLAIQWPALSAWPPVATLGAGLGALLLIGFGILGP